MPGYSLEELVGGELDGAVGEDADHLRPVPLVQRQEPLRTHHPHSQQCKSQLALCGGGREVDGNVTDPEKFFPDPKHPGPGPYLPSYLFSVQK